MDIIKNLNDFIDTGGQSYSVAKCLKSRLQSDVCAVKIKNREYMLKYLEPNNDFIIHTTAMPCSEPTRLLA